MDVEDPVDNTGQPSDVQVREHELASSRSESRVTVGIQPFDMGQSMSRSASEPPGWSAVFPWTVNIKKASFAHFDTVLFKRGQLEAINAVMSNRDVFVKLPTGGGKTRCYMLPAAVRSGLTVVISPLIALIKDQLRVAYTAAIPAGAYCSGISIAHLDSYRERLHAGYLKLFYMTPEKFATSKEFRKVLDSMYARGKVDLFAIDEAHCICDADDDFRSAYRSMKLLRQLYPTVPIVCLSGSLTSVAQRSIEVELGLRDAVSICAPADRPNVFYEFRKRPSSCKAFVQAMISRIAEFHGVSPDSAKEMCGIVYCSSVKLTATIADELRTSMGIKTGVYHGRLSALERDASQLAWMRGEVHVMVATKAFGLGVDKPDVRHVISYDLPSTLDEFVQQSGRGGRDGARALACVFWTYGDKNSWQQIFASKAASGGSALPDDIKTRRLYEILTVAAQDLSCREPPSCHTSAQLPRQCNHYRVKVTRNRMFIIRALIIINVVTLAPPVLTLHLFRMYICMPSGSPWLWVNCRTVIVANTQSARF